MRGAWQVGVDIGGTFTDVVAVHAADGTVLSAKTPSRPDDPVASVEAGLAAVGLAWADVADLMHGTTMATNAIVQDKLAPVVLLTTEGFADTLAIGRQNRRELYRLDVLPKLPPLVPAERRLEVAERLDWDGSVLSGLSEAETSRACDAAAACGVDAAAVALLHSYANPAHEKALGAKMAAKIAHVTMSHELNPEPREYERTNATVLNAALMPLVGGYLDRLEANAGETTRLHLFHSAGGMAAVDAMRGRPLGLALSGPAAGVTAAGIVARELGLDRAIAFDMGGTTTDAAVVIDGEVQINSDQRIAGRPIRQLMVAVESIGAGGGSIARLDGSAIRVGPDSAGADPGPACYGAGGETPTVTDANLVLGYINTDRQLGGTVTLDKALARRAVGGIADAFGVGIEEAALGIHRVANASMVRALRRVTVERGIDARQCTLLAFGGAGPMHAVELARACGIDHVVVPRLSSGFSALGCVTARLTYAEQRTVRMARDAWNAADLAALCDDMVSRLSAPLTASGVARDAIDATCVALMHYAGQSDAIEVPFDRPADPATLAADFIDRHQRLYGFATDEPWVLDTLRITVTAPPPLALSALSPTADGADTEASDTTLCWFDAAGPVESERLARDGLTAENRHDGPVVIEDAWSTVIVPPGSTVWADEHGHLHIDVGGKP
ncbi:MAG: hydantoinase/oxoprolinase family protein [Pseudomonadota bacterium]